MKYLLCLLASLFTIQYTYAQSTEINYYDKNYKEVNDPDAAVYVKKIVLHPSGNDNTGTLSYYTNDTLTTIARSNNLEKKIWHGEVKHYRKNGTLQSIRNYQHAYLEGESIQYFRNGAIAVREIYTKDTLSSEQFYTPEGWDTNTNLYERKAIPPSDYRQIVNNNLKYPKEAKQKNIQGRIMVSFTIEKDGTISDVQAQKNELDPSLGEEAVRVISLLPAFQPAIRDGVPVKFKFRIPVDFKLNTSDRKDIKQQ